MFRSAQQVSNGCDRRQRAIEYGLPKEKIRTIYSGIDLDKFPVTEIPMIKRPLKILFVGRLIEKKGIMYLLKAFKEVLKEIPQAKLVIAGNGKLFGEAHYAQQKN
jgi:glycosyltransferase involved in cell wall biosynthesis